MPADIADVAQELNETRLENALQKHRRILTIPFSGRCLACDEEIGQRRYCDSDCRSAHEDQMRRKALGR